MPSCAIKAVGGHTSTLWGTIYISLTWAGKKRRFPLEGMFYPPRGANKKTNIQTDKQTDRKTNNFQNQIFVDSVGHI